MSNLKVLVLMAGRTALVVALGGAIGGQAGILLALAMAGIMSFVTYSASSNVVLKMYRARTVEEHEAPEPYGGVDRLRQRAGLEERGRRAPAAA